MSPLTKTLTHLRAHTKLEVHGMKGIDTLTCYDYYVNMREGHTFEFVEPDTDKPTSPEQLERRAEPKELVVRTHEDIGRDVDLRVLRVSNICDDEDVRVVAANLLAWISPQDQGREAFIRFSREFFPMYFCGGDTDLILTADGIYQAIKWCLKYRDTMELEINFGFTKSEWLAALADHGVTLEASNYGFIFSKARIFFEDEVTKLMPVPESKTTRDDADGEIEWIVDARSELLPPNTFKFAS